jgi:16S rRNA (uracil1498-N3)-methyltransferase
MMPPRFFCPMPLAEGRAVTLPESVAHHARRVLRLDVGDDVVLFDGCGGEYSGRVADAGRDLRVLLVRHDPIEREAPLAISLAQGLVAGEKMHWLTQKAVELGVTAIAPLETERAVVRLSGERAAKRIEHLRQVAVSACEQCGRNRVPQIEALACLPDYLVARSASRALKLMLTPGAARPLRDFAPEGRPVFLLVGPEGGLSPNEVLAAQSAGFAPVAVGPRVLRTETAGLAAVAALLAHWGDL